MTDAPSPHAAARRSVEPPHELAFLELGERLRQRGQLDAAASVALSGLAQRPSLAAGHDLLARVRADQGDDAAAVLAWQTTLECDPSHVGARKGLAFVAFRARDFAVAERQLELAAAHAPHDASVTVALDRVRAVRPGASGVAPSLTDPASGALLFDLAGMRLAGGPDDRGGGGADAFAAEGAGLAREAERVARMLGLGRVEHVTVESRDARFAMVPIRNYDAGLLLRRGAGMPVGRLVALAGQAAVAAAEWLGRIR